MPGRGSPSPSWDAHNYSPFQPLLYEVAGAIGSVEDITHSIRGLLRGQRNGHFRLGRAVAVDLDRREVSLEDDEPLLYDFLILATGVRADLHCVPGAAAHGFPLKTLEGCARIRNHLIRRLETVAALTAELVRPALAFDALADAA